MKENVIETIELTKKQGNTYRVKELHMTIPKGCVYGFLGPNGAGKTTTMKLILGLIKPPFPTTEFVSWIGLCCLGMLCICGLQNFLSLVIHNFAIPIGIGFVLGIVSLMLITQGKYYLLPYSIMSVGMRANNPSMKIDYSSFILTVVIHLVVYAVINIVYLCRADVRTHE